MLELEVALAERRGSLRLLGVDPLRAGLIQPALFADVAGDFLELFAPDGVFLSTAAAEGPRRASRRSHRGAGRHRVARAACSACCRARPIRSASA